MPFQPGLVLSKLSQFAGARRQEVSEPSPAPVQLDQGALMDLKALMPPEPFCEFVILCLQGAEGHVRQIDDFFAAGDCGSVAREAHMLVSVAGNIGAMQLSALAREVEIAARNQPVELGAKVARLDACLKASLPLLRAEVSAVRRKESQKARA